MNNEMQSIAILQYNVNRSHPTTDSILNHPSSAKYPILMLQEHYWSKYTNSAPIHHSWNLIQAQSQNQRPRAAIYINNRILPSSTYNIIPFPSSDIMGISVNFGHNKNLIAINVYNTKDAQTLLNLQTYLQQNQQRNRHRTIIIGGDFNLHHPMWNPHGYTVHDEKANDLVEIMAQNGIELLSPAGKVTFPRGETTIDLTWGNTAAQQLLLKCRIADKVDHGSDHLPIETILNLQTTDNIQNIQKAPYDYRKTNWEEFKSKLTEYLPSPTNTTHHTRESVDHLATQLVNAIQRAIDETTPRKSPSPFSKRWWNDELTKMRKETNKLRNKSRRTKREEDIRCWKEKLKEYRKKINQAKRDTWRKFVSEADERTIWQVKKYLDSQPTSTFVSTLNNQATSNQQKSDLLSQIFFPPPPCAETDDIPNTTYPEPHHVHDEITEGQLKRAVD